MTKQPRILVIEDDPGFVSLLQPLLEEKLAAEVVVARDGASARDALASSSFDLITLAYQLPDSDGIEVLEEIGSKDRRIPIVMVTGQGDETTAARAVKAGAAGYVVKDRRLAWLLPSVLGKALDTVRLENALHDSEIRYRRLFEAAEDGILLLDATTGAITDVNPFLVDLLGYSCEEMLGKNLWEIGAFKDIVESKKLFATLQEKEYVRYEHLPLESKYGHRVDVEFVSNVYAADQEKVIQCNIRDITDHNQTKRDLRRVNTELEAYAQTVSHDLKGPMASVGMSLALLRHLICGPQSEEVGSDTREVIDLMGHSIERVDDLIGALLTLAEAGQTPGDVVSIDICQVVKTILEERSDDIKINGIAVDFDDDLGRVLGAYSHIYQVFSNLIGNAINHNDSQAPMIEIKSLENDVRGGHRYLVRDNGSGIPPEDLESIFTPLFKRRQGGSGIGLSTVEKIVELYGGKIGAYNDNGACFEFTLKDWPPEPPDS